MFWNTNNKAEKFIEKIKENPSQAREDILNLIINSIQKSSKEQVENILNKWFQGLLTIEHITSKHIRWETEREKRMNNMTLEQLWVVIEWDTVYLDDVDTDKSQWAYSVIKETQQMIEQRKWYIYNVILNSILGIKDTFDIMHHWSSYITKKNLKDIFQYFGYNVILTEINTIEDYKNFFQSDRWKKQIASWWVKEIEWKLDFRVSFFLCAPALIPVGNYTLVQFLETIPQNYGVNFSQSDRTNLVKVQNFMRHFFQSIGYVVSKETEIPTEELTDYIDFFESDLWKMQLQDTHNITLKDNKVIFPGEDCLVFNANMLQTNVRNTCIDLLWKMEKKWVSTWEYNSQQIRFDSKDLVKIMTLFFEHFWKEVIIQKKEDSE